MERKVVSGIMFTLFLVGMLMLAFNIQPVKCEATTIVVPDDYPTIQEAINHAYDRDTIYVRNGTYYEHVIVNKTVSFVGENKGSAIIDGNGTGTVVRIVANNVTVMGFTIRSSGSTTEDCGIYVYNSNSVMISQNNINNNTRGILVYYSDNTTVSENTVKNNCMGVTLHHISGNNISANVLYDNENGISLNDAEFNTLSRNNITKNKDYGFLLVGVYFNNVSENSVTKNDGRGIYISGSGYNILRRNNISDNRYNFGAVCGSGEELSYLINDIDTSNKVNGKPVYYWVNEHRQVIPADAGYVGIVNSTEITIENLTLTNNYYGIMLEYTKNSTLRNVNISNNFYGVLLYESTNNSIIINNVRDNTHGIELDNSNGNYIGKNNVENSGIGIYLGSSSKNTLFRNDVTNTNSGIWLRFSGGNTISKNIITNNLYVGVSLSESSSYNTLSENTISNNTCPLATVKLYKSSNNYIHANSVTNNTEGIWLDWHSMGNTISKNVIANNSGYGVSIQTFSNAIVAGNSIESNGCGLFIFSNNSMIYHNNFINNTNQAINYRKEMENIWDDGYPSCGNYWSYCNSTDLLVGPDQNETGSDGIGDTAYIIDEYNRDQYPLMAPMNIFDAGTFQNVTYHVNIISNSTVSNFHFNPDEGAFLKFNVTGEDGLGFCRVTIPKDLLWVKDGWTVYVGDELITDYMIIPDENCTYLYFNYNHSTKTVQITGTHAIPEFSPITILLLFMIPTLIAAIVIRKIKFRYPKLGG